jgi:ubiquinone/menaquinone biosynthesis C-methylase UbiE
VSRSEHWNRVYSSKRPGEVSWHQPRLATSLELIAGAGLAPDTPILDAGGGLSTLVDDLLEHGFEDLSVVDVSAVALRMARERMGYQAGRVTWVEGDLTRLELPAGRIRLWHDRAVFHFLTVAGDRRAYVETLLRALAPDGHVVLATFALTGPTRCSGLEIIRYSPETLHEQLGDEFELLRAITEAHATPSGKSQDFVFCHFRRTGRAGQGDKR